MSNCCGKDSKCCCDQLNVEVSDTQKGVRIDISAKDEAKTGSLKALIKALHDFCGC